MMVQWVPQDAEPTMVEVDDLVSVEPASVFGSLESFRPLQWAPDAVSAPAAWTTGAIGAGARVAIVDGGIRDTHIDIAPELDVAHSRSFVPGRPFNFDQRVNPATGVCGLTDTFWHGTHVAGMVAVAATGPLGFAVGATDYDRPASYTNFGQSAVDFAAPGGDDVFEPAAQLCTLPRLPSGVVTTNCWVFDRVIAPCRGSGTSNVTYCWADGTSMAAPAVSGVAALIIGKLGRLPPAQVIARVRVSADDLGKPGNDDFYGGGRVNALRAVQ